MTSTWKIVGGGCLPSPSRWPQSAGVLLGDTRRPRSPGAPFRPWKLAGEQAGLGFAVVHEFMVRIETPNGTDCDGEKAAQVDDAIEPRPQIASVVTDHSSQSGTISSTFRVRARTVDDAQEIALRAFTAALVASVSSEHGWLLIDVAGP